MRIALIGYGRMGRSVEEVAGSAGHQIVARLRSADNRDSQGLTEERLGGAEVGIDFTEPDAVTANIEGAAAVGLDLVVGTTGWYDQLDRMRDVIREAGTGLIYAPNFSLGTQIFFRLARAAGRLIDRLQGYDVFVLESHHRHKLDHPSGTARRLAEILLAEVSTKTRWEQAPGVGPAEPDVLQVGSIRAGENPGLHVVGVEGRDDQIELRHQARGRSGFARGAVMAAEWVHGRRGVFTIDDMLAEKLGRTGPEVG